MLRGKKCSLRPLVIEDVKYLNTWNQSEETMKYLGGGFKPVSLDTQKKWMENMIDTSGFSISKRYMILDEDSTPVGLIGLYGIDWIAGTCTIGEYLGEKDARGKGIAREAYTLLEKFAKNHLNIRKISLNVVDDNAFGVNFWLRQKFENVGRLKEERYIDGKYCDVVIMEKFI